MSITTIAQNPLKAAKAELVRDFLGLQMPVYPANPSPSDHEAFAGAIREAAIIFDKWLAACGSVVRDNAVTAIDANLFAGSFLGAVDGNETYACEAQGEALRADAEERRSARRGGW